MVVKVVQEREVEHTVSIYKPRHLLKKEYTNRKKLYGHNNNNYLNEDMPIMCFDPCKITFFSYDILQVCTKTSVNLIFRITSLTTLLGCSVNIHGIEFILTCSPLV